jgi:hypothetical protein
MRIWHEHKEIRSTLTGDGIVESRKGDIVLFAVIERWSDASEAIEAMRRFITPPKVEEP